MKSKLVVVALVLSSLLLVSGQETRNTKTTIQKYFGTVTWQAGTGEKQVKCLVTDVDSTADPPGEFEWKLGSKVLINDNEPTEVEDNEYEQILDYTPKIEDDKKSLICSYKTLNDFGDVLHTTESSPLNVLIESNKFPKSPFKAGNYQPGQPVEFVIEFEKYPDPRPENVVWVVKDDDDKTQEFKPGMKDSAKKYQAGDLKSLGDHKFSTSFTISNADAEEVNKDHYLVVKGSDAKKSENKIEVVFELSEAREAAPETTTTTEKQEETAEGPQASQLNVGIIIIMVLVILIILICIGYCIYKKYGRKPEPRDPQRPDPKAGKGEYQPAATADPENPA